MLLPIRGRVTGLGVLQCEVDHRTVGSRSMPVALAGIERDCVARTQLADRATLALDASDAGRDVQRLSGRMRVPRRPSAGAEVDAGRAQPRRVLRLEDPLEPNRAR